MLERICPNEVSHSTLSRLVRQVESQRSNAPPPPTRRHSHRCHCPRRVSARAAYTSAHRRVGSSSHRPTGTVGPCSDWLSVLVFFRELDVLNHVPVWLELDCLHLVVPLHADGVIHLGLVQWGEAQPGANLKS